MDDTLVVDAYIHVIVISGIIEREKSFDWGVNAHTNCKFRYDFYVEMNGNKRIIELDGVQHFKNVSLFKSNSVEKRQKVDTQKTLLVLENNIPILRILQEDVWDDHILKNEWDWISVLRSFILQDQEIQQFYAFNNCKTSSTIMYDQHKKLLAVAGTKRKAEFTDDFMVDESASNHDSQNEMEPLVDDE